MAIYFAEREAHGSKPSFYLEMGDMLLACDNEDLATDVLLSALELPVANDDTATAVANRLLNAARSDLAIQLLRKVAHQNPRRPQPHRNLAQALAQMASRSETDSGDQQILLREAIQLLVHIIATPWDEDFDGIELIAVMEANRLVAELESTGTGFDGLDPRLRRLLDVDIRIIMTWNMDIVDMDLWVDEPTGERAIYSFPLTSAGGRLSNDMTRGYGPEEYLLRRAIPGKYEVRADYFENDLLNPNGAVIVRIEVFRNWGRPGEAVDVLDLELSDSGENYLIGTFEVGNLHSNSPEIASSLRSSQ